MVLSGRRTADVINGNFCSGAFTLQSAASTVRLREVQIRKR